MACPSAANRETATSLSPLARLGSGGHGAAISQALPVATAFRSTAITSARSSSSALRVELRHLPDNKVEMNGECAVTSSPWGPPQSQARAAKIVAKPVPVRAQYKRSPSTGDP